MVLLTFGGLAIASVLLAARLLPESGRLERACGAATILYALGIAFIYGLSALSAVAPRPFLGLCALTSLIAFLGAGTKARALARDDLRAALRGLSQMLFHLPSVVAALVTLSSLMLAAAAVYLLEPWTWDAYAYHLPIVYDALQTRTIRVVPTGILYINCYPRLIEIFFVGWRLSFPDDTWMELAQLPFGFGGVLAIATLAARGGAAGQRALALAGLWLAIPVVMLELATAYIDVAVAAMALLALTLASAAPRTGTLFVASIATGILLGSKASAPPIAAMATSLIIARAVRARQWTAAASSPIVVFAIGGWKYVENIVLHQNPVWPAQLQLGPISLPGRASALEIASAGLPEPYWSQNWLERLLSSWTATPETYVFDMRIGGFGPLFTFGLLPLLVAVLLAALTSRAIRAQLRPVSIPIAILILGTLATPGAFWARYTLAVPAALLALAIVLIEAMPIWGRGFGYTFVIGLSLAGVVSSEPGFTEAGLDDEPSLWEIARMDPREGVYAQSLDEQEHDWQEAKALLEPGEAFGYDPSYPLPGRLWRYDGSTRVVYFDQTEATYDELLEWVQTERVGVIVLGEDGHGSARVARAHPESFRELFRSKYPDWQPCAIFEIVDDHSRARWTPLAEKPGADEGGRAAR